MNEIRAVGRPTRQIELCMRSTSGERNQPDSRGNTIIIKPSPFTPLGTLKVAQLCQGVLPPGPDQAFGGHKQSGIGCENSLHGLMEYTNWTTTTLNKNDRLCASSGTKSGVVVEHDI